MPEGAQQQINDYGSEHSEKIIEWGTEVQKVGTTFIFKPGNSGKVRTNEGELTYGPTDYIATDPKSGHVWPVASEYVEMNYRPVENEVKAMAAMPMPGPDYRREIALEKAITLKIGGGSTKGVTELAEEFYEFLTKEI